jgi:hypothetical protein
MKETITKTHCDICGREYSCPGIIDFTPFYEGPVKLFLMGRNKDSHKTVQMYVCPWCARKIETFLENMERKENE